MLERVWQRWDHRLIGSDLVLGREFYATEIETKEKKKPHFLMYKDGVGIIIELKYMPDDNQRNSAYAGLKQILEQRYYSLLSSEEYFVKPATGYLLIGLSFNANLQVSMYSLQNKVPKTFADLCENGKVLRKQEIEALLGVADVIS
ncbi:hypothetical protein ANN_26218 [Periplaneta americana]|uniref:Uncharacterized protein n=1 Tax=Periplaneta americana TaxID=6978 RepID=A0ABQ8S5U3_PERAM|nr:hypothetical protein ANN_26218 [Periplaneta americana]